MNWSMLPIIHFVMLADAVRGLAYMAYAADNMDLSLKQKLLKRLMESLISVEGKLYDLDERWRVERIGKKRGIEMLLQRACWMLEGEINTVNDTERREIIALINTAMNEVNHL